MSEVTLHCTCRTLERCVSIRSSNPCLAPVFGRSDGLTLQGNLAHKEAHPHRILQ